MLGSSPGAQSDSIDSPRVASHKFDFSYRAVPFTRMLMARPTPVLSRGRIHACRPPRYLPARAPPRDDTAIDAARAAVTVDTRLTPSGLIGYDTRVGVACNQSHRDSTVLPEGLTSEERENQSGLRAKLSSGQIDEH